jgi:hypothetical protein
LETSGHDGPWIDVRRSCTLVSVRNLLGNRVLYDFILHGLVSPSCIMTLIAISLRSLIGRRETIAPQVLISACLTVWLDATPWDKR